MGADQDNHTAVPPQASGHPAAEHPGGQPPGPSRRQVLRGAGAGLGAAA